MSGWICGFLLVYYSVNTVMTTFNKSRTARKPWINSNKQFRHLRLSTRRKTTDWDEFHHTMQSLILNTRDPVYREHLRKLYQKVDKLSEPVL